MNDKCPQCKKNTLKEYGRTISICSNCEYYVDSIGYIFNVDKYMISVINDNCMLKTKRSSISLRSKYNNDQKLLLTIKNVNLSPTITKEYIEKLLLLK